MAPREEVRSEDSEAFPHPLIETLRSGRHSVRVHRGQANCHVDGEPCGASTGWKNGLGGDQMIARIPPTAARKAPI